MNESRNIPLSKTEEVSLLSVIIANTDDADEQTYLARIALALNEEIKNESSKQESPKPRIGTLK